MSEVEVNDCQSRLAGIVEPTTDAVRSVFKREGVTRYEVSVALVDDRRIAELNRLYLRHDGPTDVLSFPLSEGAGVAGEVVVSVERAVAVASRRNKDAVGEVLLYVVHGCLHLLGYDDRTPGDAKRMHGRENQILTSLGYPDAYGDPCEDL